MKTPPTKSAPVQTYATQIYIWSAIGHTPITKRKGAYCDKLREETIECDSPASAKARVQELLAKVPHADRGFYYVIGYPNQNTCHDFVMR